MRWDPKGNRSRTKILYKSLGSLAQPNLPSGFSERRRKMFVAREIFGSLVREGKVAVVEATLVDVTIHKGWYGPQAYSHEYVEVDGRGIFLIPLGEAIGAPSSSSIIRSLEDRWREQRKFKIECKKNALKGSGFPVLGTHDVFEKVGWTECYGEVLVGILHTESERKEMLEKILSM